MPTPNSLSPEIRELIERHYNPDFSDRRNALTIIKLENIKHLSADTFRRYIGMYRGEKMEAETASNTIDIMNLDTENEILYIPESWYQESPTYEIPNGYNNTLIINDVHIPFHNLEALKAALKYGKDRGVDSIYINGDLMDFYALSFFSKDPKYRRFKQEIETGEGFFKGLRHNFPNVKIFYKMGNHEERFERYLRDKAEDLDGLVTIEGMMKLKDYGIEIIDGRKIVKKGKLYLLHGHEIRVSSALVNIARTVRLRTSVNTIVGHHHKTQEDYNKDLADQITGSWAVGCLCGLRPDYMPVNNWNHGFALVESDRSFFEIHNKKIVNGRIL